MSFKRIIYLILMIVAGYSVYYLYNGQSEELVQVPSSSELPALSGHDIENITYNEDGIRSYRVVSKLLEHYAKSGDTVFEFPALSVYRDGQTEEWRITADHGVLDKNQILTLYGNVLAENLLPEASFDTMATEKLLIHLTNRNFWADSQVLLAGPDFETKGQKMKGNFSDNTATLYDRVQGRYETLTP
ncbi:LPS export ABC transporter periplasmic protein LptC [Vibrio albus]|jgi:lipopolysaccharide export system protein LptC|uniref:Lipopolysaccharide export system protein LptC n=1 Tax=Vibrio albus TaxID=2200953 RepID=A0A2U3B9Q0_9VIBR|nr:LPS export ABC transporter periplasmic protein LptC [Vibrio albus]PWI33512.1 LPS export ABC transporter periplasmic protein LptC [Vibrio albus]